MIKTFRGKLADAAQQTIRLSTNNGLTGYKIHKLQIIPVNPSTSGAKESTVQIFATKRSGAISATITTVDFTDPTLMAVATWIGSDNPIYQNHQQVIFEDKIINQDLFITHTNTDGSGDINYYLELEQVKLDLNEATVATLKDMRGRE